MNNFVSKDYKITSKELIAPNVFTFRLSGHLPFKPGQFIEALIPHIGEATFAPCSDPADHKQFDLCVKACGHTTNKMVELLPGDMIQIRGPYGNGWPTDLLEGKDLIIIAGGLGLVPLRPLLFKIIKNRIFYGDVKLFGGFRTKEHVLFKDDLEKWQKKISVNIYLEQPASDSFFHHGLITKPLETTKFNVKKSVVLICGPEVMVPFVLDALKKHDFKDDQIFISYERRMECGIGICQHCSIGKYLVCKDGPVFRYSDIKGELAK